MASDVRRKRVAERLKEEVASILLSEMKDPRIGMVSVVRVKLSPDLRDAVVFVSILGDDAAKKNSMNGLRHARGFIQTLVSKRMELRFAPIIKFYLDESIEKAIKVSKLIDDLAAERRAREAAAGGAADADPDSEGSQEDDDDEEDVEAGNGGIDDPEDGAEHEDPGDGNNG